MARLPTLTSRYYEAVNPAQAPLYEIKANLFRGLAHPVRLRVLELLTTPDGDTEVSVTELLAELAITPSHLSGHLAVLKRHGVVVSRRTGSHVHYRVTHPAVADLLTSARAFLRATLSQESDRLALTESLPPLP